MILGEQTRYCGVEGDSVLNANSLEISDHKLGFREGARVL